MTMIVSILILLSLTQICIGGSAPTTGACCHTNRCTIETSAGCHLKKGSFAGVDTLCFDACGACCVAGKSCHDNKVIGKVSNHCCLVFVGRRNQEKINFFKKKSVSFF